MAAAVCLLLVVTAVRPAHAQGLPDPDEAKAANVCHKAIGKAGAAFASKKLKHLRKCIDAVFACVQLKGSSTDCLTHAETICDKEFDKILNKELPKLQGAIAKRCNEEKIPYDVLRMATGADLDALAAECVALDVVLPFNSLDKYVECVYRHHECNAEELLRFEAPRAEELLAMVNRPLKSDFCIPPTPTPTRTRTPTPTRTATPTRTLTPTPTVTPTVPPATSTAETPTPTLTPTGTATETPSPTPTATDTGPTPSPTVTSTPNPFNFTFVTSTVHQGNFGGLAGGDTICSQRATAAGLPGTYVAWLSTSSIDAASRLGSAQGWIAIDGTPFANTVADIVGNKIFNPLRLDENGVDIGTAATWTGTLKTGIESVGFTCNDWTEFMTGQGLTGNTQGGPASWTQDKNNNCVNARRLRCFRTDLAANLAPPPVSGKIAFATLVNFTPGGGRNAADAICTSEASANGLPGTYKALISTTTESAASRFTLAAAYRRPDGILIGSGAMLAAGGILKSGIWQTANGTYLNSASEAAWTGALTPNDVGTLASTCDDWSATTSTQGVFGFATYADATWWNFGTRNCNTGLHVYCVQE